jgi:hypothetical protein
LGIWSELPGLEFVVGFSGLATDHDNVILRFARHDASVLTDKLISAVASCTKSVTKIAKPPPTVSMGGILSNCCDPVEPSVRPGWAAM